MTDAPTQLGSYEVEGEIGRGGMGVVYRARDVRLQRTVAIKMLPPEVAGDPERLARFEREARILASLRHPGIAGIYSIEDAGDTHYLALEYVEGPTLADRLEAGPLPVAEALDVARQIAAALEAAHEAGVIHRDLKPGNVKITPGGDVKVLDFGLARMEEPVESPSLSRSPTLTIAATRVGVVMGTAAYMSPEQARGRPVDRRTDIWSFGCVLYECLTGRQQFPGETVSDSIARILERATDLSLLPIEVPVRVRELLERCLAKDPRDRLRDIGDARLVLEEALQSRTPSGRFAPFEPRRGVAPAAASVAVAAIAAAAVGIGAGLAIAPHIHPAAEPLRAVSISMPAGESIRGSSLTMDGRTVMVSATPRDSNASGGGIVRLLARPIGSDEFHEVPGTEGLVNSLTEPDGRTLLLIAPVTAGSAQKRLVRLPVDGSAPATPLADWRDSWNTMTRLDNGDVVVTDGQFQFVRIPRNGGEPSAPRAMQVTRAGKVSEIDFVPGAVPGGAFANVIAYDSRGWHYSVGMLDPAAGRVNVVVDDGGNPIYWGKGGILFFARARSIFAARFDPARHALRSTPVAVWSGLRTNIEARPGFFRVLDDGSLYYAPGGSAGGRRLGIMDAAGNITPWPGERRSFDDTPTLAPDGHRFVCSIANARGIDELWIGDIGSGRLRRLGTDPDADCTQPAWSPDGSRIAYKRQAQDARDGIYVQDVTGGTPRRILKPESSESTYRPQGWFPDGSAVIVWRTLPGQSSIMRLPVTEGAEVDSSRLQALHDARGNERNPRLSPDGSMLAYVSDESGRNEVYVARFGAGGRLGPSVQVSSDGSFLCAWAPDGRTLQFTDFRNRLSDVAIPADPHADLAPRVRADLGKLDVASWTPLPGGRLLVGLRSEDEGEVSHYQLVLGFGDEVMRMLARSH